MIIAGMFASVNKNAPPPQPVGGERRVQNVPLRFQGARTLRVQQPPALVDFVDTFDSVNYTLYPVAQPPLTDTVSDGKLTMSNPSATQRNAILVQGSFVDVPQIFHSVDVTDISTPLSGYCALGVGLFKDIGNWWFFEYDATVNQLRLDYNFNGAGGQFVDVRTLSLTPPFQLGIGIVGDQVIGYVKRPTDADWVPYSSTKFYILPRERDLQNYKPAMIFAANVVSSVTLDNWTAGRFGSYGIRDVTAVTDEAGLPNIESNKVYATATLNDPLGNSYGGVVRVDLSTYDIEITGVLMVERGGKVQNDVASSLIHYPDNSSRLCMSTWGNGFGGALQILHKLDAADLRHGAHRITGMVAFNLPNVLDSNDGVYDPHLVYDGGQWRLTYSFTADTSFPGNPYTGFYPCVASSPDLATWVVEGTDPVGGAAYEGTKFLRYEDGSLQILAGGPNGYRVYDSSLNYVGPLSARSNGLGNTQPHPMVFGHGDYFHMLTFNGAKPSGITAAFTWGQLEASKSPRYRLPDSPLVVDRLLAYPAAGWSLRKLHSFYDGPGIRVAVGVSNDSPEMDVGFDSSGEIDEAAMLAFLAANPTQAQELRVTVLYDQCGTGRDILSILPRSGPLIYAAGAFVREAGRIVMPISGNFNQYFAPVDNTGLVKRDYAISALARNDEPNSAGSNWYAMNGLVFSEYPGVVHDFGFGKMNNVIAHGQGNGSTDFWVGGNSSIGGALRQLAVTRKMDQRRVRLYVDNVKQADDVSSYTQTEHTSSAQFTIPSPWRLQELILWSYQPDDAELSVIFSDQASRT